MIVLQPPSRPRATAKPAVVRSWIRRRLNVAKLEKQKVWDRSRQRPQPEINILGPRVVMEQKVVLSPAGLTAGIFRGAGFVGVVGLVARDGESACSDRALSDRPR